MKTFASCCQIIVFIMVLPLTFFWQDTQNET